MSLMKKTEDFRQRAIRVQRLRKQEMIFCCLIMIRSYVKTVSIIFAAPASAKSSVGSSFTSSVGACSNSVGARQRIDESFQTIEEYIQYAEQNNAYDPFRHQKRLQLIGFALLIKRDLWDDIGGLDEVYGLGNFEDDDICLNILKGGYDFFASTK